MLNGLNQVKGFEQESNGVNNVNMHTKESRLYKHRPWSVVTSDLRDVDQKQRAELDQEFPPALRGTGTDL